VSVLSHPSSQVGNEPEGPVVKPSDLDTIIKIKWSDTYKWQVSFPETQADMFTTAPRAYTLKPGRAQALEKQLAENPQRESGPDLKLWQVLLHNKDLRLTARPGTPAAMRYNWYRLKLSRHTFSWPQDGDFDNVIRFITEAASGTAGEPIAPRVSRISFLKLQRVLQGLNLHVPQSNPYKRYKNHGSPADVCLRLKGFWGRSEILPVTVSDFRKA
jgi:hypothetical protein